MYTTDDFYYIQAYICHQAHRLGPGYISFMSFCTLLMVFVIYRLYICIEDTGGIQVCNDKQNGPK